MLARSWVALRKAHRQIPWGEERPRAVGPNGENVPVGWAKPFLAGQHAGRPSGGSREAKPHLISPEMLPSAPHLLTHLLAVVLGEFVEQPSPLLGPQVPQEGGQDGADVL